MFSSHARWISEAGTHVELRMASLMFVSTSVNHIGVADSLTDGVCCVRPCVSVCVYVSLRVIISVILTLGQKSTISSLLGEWLVTANTSCIANPGASAGLGLFSSGSRKQVCGLSHQN